jgi:hypothetical protein
MKKFGRLAGSSVENPPMHIGHLTEISSTAWDHNDLLKMWLPTFVTWLAASGRSNIFLKQPHAKYTSK